ncbi:MAG: dephospho-CoA kinase [Muribaculaceae bacterium]|nr:dephospho-CoA kinase [Muribaculaceae bacterium]
MLSPTNNLIGITGGIGSGKSIVSRILRLKGYYVYDCDYQAKILMDNDPDIISAIRDDISSSVITDDGHIVRAALAAIIFDNEILRLRLNNIVHSAVKREILDIRRRLRDVPLFVESAIIAESGLAQICDTIWVVSTDDEGKRIDRVTKRNNCDAASVQARIRAQKYESELLNQYQNRIHNITNEDMTSVLSQVNHLLSTM